MVTGLVELELFAAEEEAWELACVSTSCPFAGDCWDSISVAWEETSELVAGGIEAPVEEVSVAAGAAAAGAGGVGSAVLREKGFLMRGIVCVVAS